MITKITTYIIELVQNEIQEGSKEGKRGKKLKDRKINVAWVENKLAKLFTYRRSDQLSSRVRFMIQDVIDQYNKEWKDILMSGEGTNKEKVDAEGF